MMKFQVILIFSFCYSAVKGGPGGNISPYQFILKPHVNTGFNIRLCKCNSGSPTKIARPIPSPYVVGMRKGVSIVGTNALGSSGVDAMDCIGSCPPPRLANLQVQYSLSSGTSDDPNDERLTIYTSDNSKFCMRRIQFKVKFAKHAWIELYDSATATISGNGMCVAWEIPNDTKWHWVRCDYCKPNFLTTIGRIDIKFEQNGNGKDHVKVKRLRIWSC